jgi:hypothetical protein
LNCKEYVMFLSLKKCEKGGTQENLVVAGSEIIDRG